MDYKTFLIGAAITIISGILFCLPAGSLPLIIPSLLFAGVGGGLYVGFKRKRPLINCAYDGFITSVPTSILLGLVLVPIFWFFHDYRYQSILFAPLFFMVMGGAILLTGIAGGAFGGLLMGLYYRYLRKDRGEMELYETYIEDKTGEMKIPKQKKKAKDIDIKF